MQNKKLQDTQKSSNKELLFNKLTLAGHLTRKGELTKSKNGNPMIKIILSETAFCIALREQAQMINLLDLESVLVVEGKLINLDNKNLILVTEVEIYTTQIEIDTKKYRKELKEEKTKF